jgi:hypothetical protein
VSATYDLFERAMRERRPIACIYQDRYREICAIVLGWSDGREKVLTYQVGGQSSRPLTTPQTRWRCMFLDEVRDARLIEGAWARGGTHKTEQSCVKDVDLDVNPLSPFNPRRLLDELG